MVLLPDWAPSIHPMIIHFPIVLLMVALLTDLLGIVLKKTSWLPTAASLLYILGALSLVAAYITGREAGDAAVIPSFAHSTLSEHADLALYTLWYFGLYGIMRLALFFVQFKARPAIPIILAVVSAIGIGILFQTAERGAELVYRHGVGVRAADQAREELQQKEIEMEALARGGISEQEDGSWSWTPREGAEIVFRRQFNFLTGKPDLINTQLVNDENAKEALALILQNDAVLFTAGPPLGNVQAEVRFNADNFKGAVMLVHHVQDAQNYDFISLENGNLVLGRVTDGKAEVEDRDAAPAAGWVTMRAVSNGSHYRGYLGDKLITHGHGDALPPGKVGLYLKGSGKILLEKIDVESLK